MSVRPRAEAHARHSLYAVLAAGFEQQAGHRLRMLTARKPDTESTSSNPVLKSITVNGVVISTDHEHWTPLSSKQIVRLQLKPRNMTRFTAMGYVGVQFASPFHSWTFWVEYLGPGTDPMYYVLMRPSGDLNTYLRDQPPFIELRGKRYPAMVVPVEWEA